MHAHILVPHVRFDTCIHPELPVKQELTLAWELR